MTSIRSATALALLSSLWGASASADSLNGTWTPYPPPSGRTSASSVYDLVHDRMIIFGGWGAGDTESNEIWVLELTGAPRWVLRPTTEPFPLPRSEASAVYDSNRNRLLIFGGSYAGPYNDVWALALGDESGWTQLVPQGTPPPPTQGHVAIYDPVGDRMVVFGYIGTWELALSGTPTWSQLTPTGTPPAGRSDATAVYDPVRQRMLLFGGYGSGFRNDTWSLSLSGSPEWQEVATQSVPPSPRRYHQAIYDPIADRMIVHGGDDWSSYSSEVWALSLGETPTWTLLISGNGGPGTRAYHTAVYDTTRHRLVTFSGWSWVEDPGPDIWALSLTDPPSWTEITFPEVPEARSDAAMVLDSRRDRMLLFGGIGQYSIRFNDVWSLPLDGPLSWEHVAAAGSAPVARSGHTAVYDARSDRMIVFSGQMVGSPQSNDLWELSLAAGPEWAPIAATGGPPPARFWHSAVYDAARDRMLVFGGTTSHVAYGLKYNDVWALSLTGAPVWTQLAPSGTPPVPRAGHTAVIDPYEDRMLVFGGNESGLDDNPPHHNDVWALSLSEPMAWTRLIPSGAAPSPRSRAGAWYDAVRRRMVLHGGGIGPWFAGSYSDTWALDFNAEPTWKLLSPNGLAAPSRKSFASSHDPLRDRWIVLDSSLWELYFGTPLAVEPARFVEALPTITASPNPFRSRLSLAVSGVANGTVRILDTQGRCVRLIHASGSRFEWDARDDQGRRVSPGVYFVTAVGKQRSVATKVVLLN